MIHVRARARCVSARLSGSFKGDQWEKDQRNNSLLLTSCIFNAHPFNIWWAQRLCRYCGVNWHTSAFANLAPKFKSQFCEKEKRPRFLWAVLIFFFSCIKKEGNISSMCEIRALVWFCKLLFFFFYCADLIFKANWASSLNTDMLLWHIIMTDLLLLPLKKEK